jgi:hypothetical protein
MISKAITRNTKNDADVKKCRTKMVSGNKPIPISARELSARRYAPILLDKIVINPRENIKARIPPKIRPLLNITAVFCWIPRSLNACCVQMNHGDETKESPRQMKITTGMKIPQIPAIRVIADCLLLI